jgi:hypothetical protein
MFDSITLLIGLEIMYAFGWVILFGFRPEED